MKKTKVDDFFTGTLKALALFVIPAIALANAVYALFDLGGVFGAILFYALAISAFLYLALGLIHIALFFKSNHNPKTYVARDDLECRRYADDEEGYWENATWAPRRAEYSKIGEIKKGDRFILRRMAKKEYGMFKFVLLDKRGKPIAFFASKKAISAKCGYNKPMFESAHEKKRREKEGYDSVAVGFPKEGK